MSHLGGKRTLASATGTERLSRRGGHTPPSRVYYEPSARRSPDHGRAHPHKPHLCSKRGRADAGRLCDGLRAPGGFLTFGLHRPHAIRVGFEGRKEEVGIALYKRVAPM